MNELRNYLRDGACSQARAVLMHLQGLGEIESSWSDKHKAYRASIMVSRWENCREQGYVVMLRNVNFDQLNIAFFEHRNSDSIHAIMWKQNTINSPTIETANFQYDGKEVYKDKHDTSHSVSFGQYVAMAEWIHSQLSDYWNTYWNTCGDKADKETAKSDEERKIKNLSELLQNDLSCVLESKLSNVLCDKSIEALITFSCQHVVERCNQILNEGE